MAIEKEIPKDIRQYEPKLIGPFTTRQVLCLIPALGLGVALFVILKNVFSTDIRLFIITFVAIPFFLLGWYKPYNMPFEKFVRTVFISTILSPLYRKYKTERIDTEASSEDQKSKKKKSWKKKKITDPKMQPIL